MRPISECSIIEVNTRISREEESKEIIFKHSEFIVVCDVVGVDSCIFKKTKGEKSCDFLFLFDKNKQEYNFLRNKHSIAYYVELKGIDLVSACEQLFNSIDKTQSQIDGFEINAVVVSTRKFIPQYDNNEFYRKTKRLIRKDIIFELTPFTVNL